MKPLLAKIGLAALVALGLFGCDETYTDDDYSSLSDAEALEELFLDDADVEGPDVWRDDADGLNAAELRALDDPIEPLGWWRVGSRERTSVVVDFIDDDHAVITRTRSFNGDFRLLTELSENEMETIDKPMYNILERQARAVRIADTPYPRRNWRIVAVTPEVMQSAAPNPNTVELLSVQAVGADGTLLADITDPLDTFFERGDLPQVFAGEEITIFVEVAGAIPGPIGVLRPHVYGRGRMPRLPINDDGLAPDEIAGDGVYTGSYRAGQRLGLHHVGVDFIDHETIYDDTAPYNATGWGFPYAVIPAN